MDSVVLREGCWLFRSCKTQLMEKFQPLEKDAAIFLIGRSVSDRFCKMAHEFESRTGLIVAEGC